MPVFSRVTHVCCVYNTKGSTLGTKSAVILSELNDIGKEITVLHKCLPVIDEVNGVVQGFDINYW